MRAIAAIPLICLLPNLAGAWHSQGHVLATELAVEASQDIMRLSSQDQTTVCAPNLLFVLLEDFVDGTAIGKLWSRCTTDEAGACKSKK